MRDFVKIILGGLVGALLAGLFNTITQPGAAVAASYNIPEYIQEYAKAQSFPAGGGCSPAQTCSAAAVVSSGAVSGTTFTGTSFTASAGSGSNGLAVSTNGARIDFGAGASDYAASNGTTVTFAGPIASSTSGSGTFSATAASGSNGFVMESGARLCYSGSSCVIRSTTDGSDVFFTSSNLRITGSNYYAVKQILPVTSAIDFNVTTLTCSDSSGITVTGAADGNFCRVSTLASAYVADISYSCYVSAANTVKVRACCGTGAPGCDPASTNFTVAVEK